MAQINIKTDIEKITRELDDVRRKQVPYAIRLTVNKLAENSKKRFELKEIPKIDRPTRYAQNMMRVDYANRSKLTSTIKVKDSALLTKRGGVGPNEVLGHLFKGGQRRGKGFEGLMRDAGILPSGMYAVPGQGVKLDQNGNIPRGLIIQLLSYFRAFKEAGFRANINDVKSRRSLERRITKKQFAGASSTNFFLVKKGDDTKLHPGIWARVGFAAGKSIKPILIFVDRASYKQLFDLEGLVNEVVKRDLFFEFDKAFKQALATAK